MNAVTKIEAGQPRSVLVDLSRRYGMEPGPFEATLRATVCKGNVSREEFAAFLLVAKEYGLNPVTKELYAFPAKGGGIQPIVSIDGWARIINDHPQFDGMEFEDVRENGDLVAITCRMYRKDRSRPIAATEYMAECRRGTDVWKTWPARMLRHKAMIQCARYAFGFSGIIDPDEYERQQTGGAPAPQRRLHADFDEPAENVTPAAAETVDSETGEVLDAEIEPAAAAPAAPAETPPETEADTFAHPARTWAQTLRDDLEADAFEGTKELDAFTGDPENTRYFQEYEQIDPEGAKRLNAQIMGRRKALADRERGRA